jgi:hypothetical protein
MVKTDAKWESASWDVVDDKIEKTLSVSARIKILSNTILSPTTKKSIREFITKFRILR